MKKIFTLVFSTFFITTTFAQPKKVVLVEEGTGTWCQWCPRGDIYGRTLAKDYPGDALFIAIHEGDPMENQEYFQASGLTGLPNGNIDRTFVSGLDPFNELPSDMAQQLALIPPAAISVSTTWNDATREMTMTVTAEFAEDLDGDYRLAAIVVEDGVTGPSPSYDQSNSYSGGGNGPMGGYEDLPSPVSASQMVYNHVGRYLAGGYMGDSGSLPPAIMDGETKEYTYNYTLPNNYNEEYVYVVGVLINASNGRVLNAGRSNYLPGHANGKPFFHSSPQTDGFVGLDYQYDILTHDPEHDDLEITAISALPDGLTLTDLGDGKAILDGTPTTQGTFNILLQVTDGEWNILQSFQLEIGEPQEDWIQLGAPGFSPTEADELDIEINSLGEPYVMLSDNNQVFLYKFENDTWAQQGATLPGSSFHVGMAIGPDDVPYIFTEGVVSKLVGGVWEQVGDNLPGGGYIYSEIIIAADGTPFVVFFTPPMTTNAYKFNGTNWELAGIVTDGVGVWNRFNLDNEGNPILIYGTDGSSILYSEVARWDGSDWDLLGDEYVELGSQTYFDHDVAVTSNGEVFAALTIGVGVQQLNIYQLVNGNWELIAENLTGGATESCNLDADHEGNLIVAYRDENAGGRTSVMKYDGNSWKNMGLAGFTNIASGQSLAVDPNGIPFVAYRDANENDRVSVKKFVDLTSNIIMPQLTDYQLNVYPNPNNGEFILEFEKGESYQILNISGNVISEGILTPDFSQNGLNYQKINLENIPKGMYFLKVIGEEGIQTFKIMSE